MKTTPPETSRRRLPMLKCSLCGTLVDVLHLGRWGRYRICTSCHQHQLSAPLGLEGAADSERMLLIRQVDAFFRGSAVVIRLLLYTGLFLLAKNTEFGPHVLTGFVLGDGITWLASAWLERHFHSIAVTLEAILYTAAFALWVYLTGGFELPDDAAAKGIVAMSFFGTFSLKGSWQAWRLLHGYSGSGS